ncbi:MAG TPA: phosphotransferase family protein [Longimicrobiaceae bacterium]|nr:phosphotransferase family protein [Longimicrobiaceae bacterium]
MSDALLAALLAALREGLASLFDAPVEIERAVLLAGGASKEAWAVDACIAGERRELLVRRAGGGVIYAETLSLEEEFRVLQAAHQAGVTAPRPFGYLPDVQGREAFVMQRLQGESVGRRIVQRPELAAARAVLPLQMAEELARIHDIAPERLPFLPKRSEALAVIQLLERELDALEEPHPAIELGLRWLREHLPRGNDPVVCHGDFRIGNLMVDAQGLVGVLDWEFAHLGDPVEDLAWPLVRSWRFGTDRLRLGGVGEVEPYLARYNELTERGIELAELFFWELAGNAKWAVGSLTQARRHLRGEERSVELAILGRLAAEVEWEILSLFERRR